MSDTMTYEQYKMKVFDTLCDLSEQGRTSELIQYLAQLRDSDRARDRDCYREFGDNGFQWLVFDDEQSSQVS